MRASAVAGIIFANTNDNFLKKLTVSSYLSPHTISLFQSLQLGSDIQLYNTCSGLTPTPDRCDFPV